MGDDCAPHPRGKALSQHPSLPHPLFRASHSLVPAVGGEGEAPEALPCPPEGVDRKPGAETSGASEPSSGSAEVQVTGWQPLRDELGLPECFSGLGVCLTAPLPQSFRSRSSGARPESLHV